MWSQSQKVQILNMFDTCMCVFDTAEIRLKQLYLSKDAGKDHIYFKEAEKV